MALARIITRSQTCSRELALALLARGYTVEIVSPDKVPDNFADLELRVDAGAANELVANVEAHNGESTTSLEFVHHLKAPVLDLLRRPLELGKTAHPSGESVSFTAGPGAEDLALPVEDLRLSPRTVPLAIETPRHREADPEIHSRGGACLIVPRIVPTPKDHLGSFAVEGTAALQPALIQQMLTQRTIVPQPIVLPTQAAQRRNRSARWPWRAGLAFVGLVVLAVVLGLGTRRIGKAAASGSDGLPAAGIVVPTSVNTARATPSEKDPARDQGQISTVPWEPTATQSEANSADGLKQVQVAKSGTPAKSPGPAVSRRHGDDLIARDTTIYFDERFKPVPKAKRAKPIAQRRAHRGEYN